MRTRWKALSTSSRLALAVHLSVAVFCFAAALIDAITVLTLNIVMGAWLVFTAVVTTRQHRRLKKMGERIKRIDAVVTGGATDLSDLPPEDQEEIQMSWARHVLNRER